MRTKKEILERLREWYPDHTEEELTAQAEAEYAAEAQERDRVRIQTKQFMDKEATWAAANKKVDGWKQVLQSADRIITGRGMRVITMNRSIPHNLQSTPGWSNGQDIFLNGTMLQQGLAEVSAGTKDIREFVVSLKGLNYHEVSHILYTPRLNDPMGDWVSKRAYNYDSRWWWLFNVLEDTRIESLFSAQYGIARTYFTATVMRYIVQGNAEAADMHVLLHGRKYLPAALRGMARQGFVKQHGQALTEEVNGHLDAYLRYTYPDDTTAAQATVATLYDLLFATVHQPTVGGCGANASAPDPHSRGGDDNHAKKGRALVREQRKAQDALDDMVEEADEADEAWDEAEAKAEATAGSDLLDDDGGTPYQGDSEGNENTDQKGEDTQHSKGGSGGGEGDSDIEADAGEAEERSSGETFGDAVQDMLDDIMDDQSMKEDVKQTAAAAKAKAEGSSDGPSGKGATGSTYTSHDVDKRAARRIADLLRELRTDLEPTWLRGKSEGRINFKALMKPTLTDLDVFDQWDEGAEDAASIEAYILLDRSTSMGGMMDEASRAMWTVKRAMELSGVDVTVIGYSDGHQVLYRKNERVKNDTYKSFGVVGGTQPQSALRQTLQHLTRSKATNKVLVSITDGGWTSDVQCDALVESLNRAGVHTVLLGLQRAVSHYGTHNHKVGYDVDSPTDIIKAFEETVTHIMRRALTNRA